MSSGDELELSILKNPDRFLYKIQDENKIVRRDGLKGIVDALKMTLASERPCEETEQNVLICFLRPITLLIKDPMEKTREISYTLLTQFTRHLRKETLKDVLSTLIPILVDRLGQPELNEPSEEVRLLGVKLIEQLLQRLGTQLNPFIDDLIQIMASTITDPYHKVRTLSCEVTSKMADICRIVFHYNSERLLRPLCLTMKHQQLRVRVAAIDCLRQVVLLGNPKGINTILPYLTQRVFDPAPTVRLAVVNAVGEWLVNFIDRYSYFHKFLPIILTLQKDETDEVPERARILWDAAGEKYLNENIEKYRDQVDFPLPAPAHYPKNVARANLGCRIITWQCVYNLLPALTAETADWVKSTRVKATLLLYYVILHCEDKITMYIEQIFPIIYRTVRDEETEVVTYSKLAANAIGYFVPLSVSWPILSSAVTLGPSEGNLLVLNAVLAGTDPIILSTFTWEVLKLMNDPDILECRSNRKNMAILSVCHTLLTLVPEPFTLVPDQSEEEAVRIFFRIVVTIWAQTQDLEGIREAKCILTKLGSQFDLNLDEVMGKWAGDMLTEISNKTCEWTPVSTDKLIFDLILSQGGLAINNNMDQILKIMLSSLNPDKDPEVRLKFLTRLAQYLELYSKTTSVDKTQMQNFAQHIIEDVLHPNLVWTAGKTAGVIRTAAVSCLLAVLQTGILNSEITKMASKIVSTILGVVEDSSETTRLISCECLCKLIRESHGSLTPDLVNTIYPVLLKRLDDVSDTVRFGALNVIGVIFTNLPLDYDLDRYKLFIENVYTTLILQLDDTEKVIQDKVQNVLESIGHLRPDLLITECMKTKMKHRSPTRCDDLISKFNHLKTSDNIETTKNTSN